MNERFASDGREWLEPDGLGGFASGTVSGVRTRRYHALLLPATTPPTGRITLVNGFDAWLDVGGQRVALSSQRYRPDVVSPDGANRIEAFTHQPWPTWTYRVAPTLAVQQEIFVPHGQPSAIVRWSLVAPSADTPEFNAVDASLWFIVAVRDLVDAAEAGKTTLAGADRDRLLVAVTEITDAEAPFTPRGCPFQAWSVGELLRVRAMVPPADGRTAGGVTSAPPVETAAPSAS